MDIAAIKKSKIEEKTYLQKKSDLRQLFRDAGYTFSWPGELFLGQKTSYIVSECGHFKVDLYQEWKKIEKEKKQGTLKKSLLNQALGRPKEKGLLVLDAMGGVGKDALFLLGLGMRVITYERHPLIFFLLREAQQDLCAQFPEIKEQWDIRRADVFKNWPHHNVFDYLYFDPMYREDAGKRLPHGKMQYLRLLLQGEENQHPFTEKSYFYRRRLILKKPLKKGKSIFQAMSAQQKKRSLLYKGRSTSYYVLPPEGGVTMNYELIGMGNALLDIEYQVQEQVLQELNLEKGRMSLASTEEQEEIISLLKKRGINPQKVSSGGSGANTVVTYTQLGGKGYYGCRVADDESGHNYWQDFHKEGVGSNIENFRATGSTGRCVVLVTADGARTMVTALNASALFDGSELDFNVLDRAHTLYIEGYLLASDAGFKGIKKVQEKLQGTSVQKVITFSDVNIVAAFKERLREVIANGVNFVFCNEEEALEYTQKSAVLQAAEVLKKEVSSFVITRGQEPALVWDGSTLRDIAGDLSIKPLDTTGAGDTYAGAFLLALARGHNFEAAGRFAGAAAEMVITQYGARLSTQNITDLTKSLKGSYEAPVTL